MLVSVRVKPNSRQPRIEEDAAGGLVAYLKSPPVEGRANEELIAQLAARFGVPKSRVRIRSGLSSRSKLVEIRQ
ncbi:MAG: DUF167 domain-containing protein [Acidobacteriota bacterium]